ncbi:MAG TPA: prepilin-type N-terminal cleavage/methylation domain-containing protein [Polyangiaceae bacterium]|nr:prepilin-type N-terminal cleavage/methylation domain-containing protein [Polyangiaceae bacterium]
MTSSFQPSNRTIRAGERGVTLIEIMVVLVLLALLASATAFGAGGLGASRLRGAAATVVAYSRVATTRTNATGLPVRMVLDLDKGRIWLEESATSRALREDAKAAELRALRPGASDDIEGPDADRARAARANGEASAELFIEGRGKQVPSFEPLKGLEIAGESVGESRELGTSIEYHQVQTEHDEEARTEGRAYLYFWPGGETEWASVQLRRSGDKSNGLTVLISPLTGRARIERGYVDLPKRNREGDISEIEGEL